MASLLLGSCNPRITTIVSRPLEPINYKEEILVFGLNEAVPQGSLEIGIVKIDDTGFTTNCGWEEVIEYAKMEARKAGGNALKITDHIPPNIFVSTCHRITAKILWVDHFDPVNAVKAGSDAKQELKDLLLLNSGDEIQCKIAGEDGKNVYFIVLKNKREIRTSLNKKSIKEIKRGAI